MKKASGRRELLPAHRLVDLVESYSSSSAILQALVFVVLKVVVDLRVDVNQLLDCRYWIFKGLKFLLLLVRDKTKRPFIHGSFS